jgi:hypothetical protein
MSEFEVYVNSILDPNRKENDIMKATLQKFISTAVLGLALFSNSFPAWAGNVSVHEVYINLDNSGAGGTLTGARYSADSTQSIGCDLHGVNSSLGPFTSCSARDKTGKALLCSTYDVRFADAVKAMTDSSYIYFSLAPGTDRCSDLVVHNSSPYLR